MHHTPLMKTMKKLHDSDYYIMMLLKDFLPHEVYRTYDIELVYQQPSQSGLSPILMDAALWLTG